MMENEIRTVRIAIAGDSPDLVRFRAYLLDSAQTSNYASRNAGESAAWKSAYSAWLADALETNDRIQIVVAEKDGELIGCATGILDQRPPAPDCPTGWCGWIQSVVVAPKWRRQGVAQQLLQALLNWFADHRASKLSLEATAEAEGLYGRLGFFRSQESLFIRDGRWS